MKMRLFVVSVLLLFEFSFIMTEVVDSFNTCQEFFVDGQPPDISGILEKSVSKDNNRYKIICQKYDNTYQFATLYDINKKIPVFSAYKYTGGNSRRPHISWMIEPQLETSDADMREPCVNQAFTGDYWNQETLNRGHLFPSAHAANENTAESTFTLTNTVPQYSKFNTNIWKNIEENVRKLMDSKCHDSKSGKVLAYVLTGAVPSQAKLLNERVNIPSHMWTTFCCHDGKAWVSQAHWAENDKKPNDAKTGGMEKLEEFLSTKYKESSLFNNC